jgi:hypothetical protein
MVGLFDNPKQNFSNQFREQFLDTHLDYLHSISYIIEKMYGMNNSQSLAEKMFKKLLEQKPKILEVKKENLVESSEFRNLRNCWYN